MRASPTLCLLTIALGGLLYTSQVDADSACRAGARNMARACSFDIRDDYHTTLANCKHLLTGTERWQCRVDARAALAEGREECDDQKDARFDVCELLDEDRYFDPLVDPNINFIHPDDVPSVYAANPYVSVVDGRTLLLRAGEDFEEAIVIHVSSDVREILGIPCRIVWDIAFEVGEDDGGEIEYEPVEVTQDWFAQSDAGDVYYCGENAQDYEDGVVASLDGSFEAGKEFDRGGILTQAAPVIGFAHRQEMALEEAEDLVEYLDLAAVPTDEEGGENPAVACAPGGCLKTFDFTPLDPASTEFKYYLADTGFVLAVSMEDGELDGEREELVCAGDDLDVLAEADCNVDDPDQLFETLCELVPDALCE